MYSIMLLLCSISQSMCTPRPCMKILMKVNRDMKYCKFRPNRHRKMNNNKHSAVTLTFLGGAEIWNMMY